MVEGSASVPLTNGFRIRVAKNLRIRNTAYEWHCFFAGCTPLPGREVRPALAHLLGADCSQGLLRKYLWLFIWNFSRIGALIEQLLWFQKVDNSKATLSTSVSDKLTALQWRTGKLFSHPFHPFFVIFLLKGINTFLQVLWIGSYLKTSLSSKLSIFWM